MSPRSPPSTSRRDLLSLCAAGAAGLAGCSAVGRDCPSPADAGDPTDWPHRHHDIGNTNAAPAGPDSLTERWTARVDATLGRPIVADGVLYAVTLPRDRPFVVRLLAFDVADGERLSEWRLPDVRRPRIEAVVDDTVFVVAKTLGPDGSDRLHAVDADGSVSWTFDADAITAVTVARDSVHVSVLHGSVVALDATDGQPCARLHPARWPGGRWLSDLTPVGRAAVLDGTVFSPVARFDTDRDDEYFEDRVVAFDASDGSRWESPVVDAVVVEEIAAVGDTVYVPATHHRDRAAQVGTASLHALEAASGKRRWEQPVGAGSISAVAARDDVVVVDGGGVQAFDPESGERRWRSEAFFGPPVVAGGQVYGRRTEGDFVDTVVAADLETGEPVASRSFDYQVNRAPVFADGRAFVRTLEYTDTDTGPEHVADRLHALW